MILRPTHSLDLIDISSKLDNMGVWCSLVCLHSIAVKQKYARLRSSQKSVLNIISRTQEKSVLLGIRKYIT